MELNNIEEPVEDKTRNTPPPPKKPPKTDDVEAITFNTVFVHREVKQKCIRLKDKKGFEIKIPISKMPKFEGLNIAPDTAKKVEVAIVSCIGDGKTVLITGKNKQIPFEKLKKTINVGTQPNRSFLSTRSLHLDCVPETFCGMTVMVHPITGEICYFVL